MGRAKGTSVSNGQPQRHPPSQWIECLEWGDSYSKNTSRTPTLCPGRSSWETCLPEVSFAGGAAQQETGGGGQTARGMCGEGNPQAGKFWRWEPSLRRRREKEKGMLVPAAVAPSFIQPMWVLSLQRQRTGPPQSTDPEGPRHFQQA